MSMARRWAKCKNACLRWALQLNPAGQRLTASVDSRTARAPQTGQWLGILKSRALDGRRPKTGPSTSGITSPARRTQTVSPIIKFLRAISSSLCNVALVTVTPPTKTGAKRATGVKAPVRPTCTSMSNNVVLASSAGNLWARAKRGARETNPARFCNAIDSNL